MPPPAHVPSKATADSLPHTVDASRGSTLVQNPTGQDHQENDIPPALISASVIVVPGHITPRPPAIQSHQRIEASRTSQPVLPNGGTAVSVPSRAVPVVVSRAKAIQGTAAAAASTVPFAPRQTENSQDPPPQPQPDVTASRSTHASPLQAGSFDMSQIDPSLQSALQTFPEHGVAAPSFIEGSSRTLDGNGAAHTSLDSGVQGGQDSGTAGNLANTSTPSQPKAKRRRTKASQEGDTSSEGRPRKRRTQHQQRDGSVTEGDDSQTGEAGRKRRGKSRAPSVPLFDPNAGPGEDLDPTAVTMSSLCDDTGQGRISSKAAQIITNHAAWRAASREKRARLRAIAEAKKYGRNIDDEEQPPASTSGEAAEPSQENPSSSRASAPPGDSQAGPSTTGSDRPTGDEQTVDDFDYSQNLASSRYNVQVRIGANGETIINEESLFVSRDEEDDTANYTHIEESDATKFVNSSSYSKKPRGSRWSAEETELFFDALSQFGENYELISYVLPGRDRKACKNKFKAEDKKNPARINFCLNHRKPFDIQTLSRMTGKDFSGPTPEIRAPTVLQSTELDTHVQPEAVSAPKAIRKKRKTPGPKDGEEILGSIEDMDKEDSLFGDDMNV
ncbi:hypothetical protein EVJ58_g7139 [Rhodofomes roseus]|uniref:Myb-like domain-containing protein n=1 Tax=Rhodofomes roseus TaxID=34475 RepID=A0A4Y9Y541_9APHY|nr:hypothetical protein EVJ58_g7139 [Rhodofomes roseus]